MRIRPVYIAIIVILFVIVLLTSSAGSTFVPYSKDTLFSREYPYEGMESGPANVAPVVQGNVVATATETPSFMDTVSSWFGVEKCQGEGCKKVEGFALQPAPFGESPVLDRYGKTPSGPECIGQGSGYSKSLGPLCMSEEDKRMLSTRGGNSTGKDSVIGQP